MWLYVVRRWGVYVPDAVAVLAQQVVQVAEEGLVGPAVREEDVVLARRQLQGTGGQGKTVRRQTPKEGAERAARERERRGGPTWEYHVLKMA